MLGSNNKEARKVAGYVAYVLNEEKTKKTVMQVVKEEESIEDIKSSKNLEY